MNNILLVTPPGRDRIYNLQIFPMLNLIDELFLARDVSFSELGIMGRGDVWSFALYERFYVSNIVLMTTSGRLFMF